MGHNETLSVLDVWLDACVSGADWTKPLTWTQNTTGARAIAIVSRKTDGASLLHGASLGAPADFLNLCRDIGAEPCAAGVQERYVVGTGRLAWAQIAPKASALLFALYQDKADLELLGQVAQVAGKCFASRSQDEARRMLSDLKSVALAQLPVGVAIIDQGGICIEANGAAKSVFARSDGLSLCGMQLTCGESRDQRALQLALKGASRFAVDEFIPVRRAHATRPYVLRVLRQDAKTAASIVMIVDPDAPPATAPDVWRAMFNLTQCEILVAQALVSGGNVTDLARRRGVTVDTVRRQKNTMLARLEVSTQAAATAMLSRVAPFAPA